MTMVTSLLTSNHAIHTHTTLKISKTTRNAFPKCSPVFFYDRQNPEIHTKTTSFAWNQLLKGNTKCNMDSTLLASRILPWKHMNTTTRPTRLQAKDNAERPLGHFAPEIWGDRFAYFTAEENSRMLRYTKDIEPLKDQVRIMLLDNTVGLTKKLSLIYTMERLGISYFYEAEIEEMLHDFFEELAATNFSIDYNLFDTALQFWIFRQHGYKMPCDVFNKFTDSNGKFNESLKNDLRGILNLYEAAHLRIHGEDVLEEALAFSTDFLKCNAKLCKQAKHALNQPLHFGAPMVQRRYFISFYEEDQYRNETLLQLAKIDYNRLQLLYRQELSQFIKWFNSHPAVKLPYVRQRSVDNHFWALAVYFEPQYSLARILFAQIIALGAVVDDTYDAYGTFEELKLLSEAFERCELGSRSRLPHNMKVVYDFVLNLMDDYAKILSKRGITQATQFVKDSILKFIIKGYFKEAEWLKAEYIPSLEEYMVVGRISSTTPALAAVALIGMEEIVDEKPFQQITVAANKAIGAVEIIGRLTDDVATSEVQLARRHVVSAVECCINEYGMSREEAIQHLNKKIRDSWKDLNEELLIKGKPTDQHLPMSVLKRVLNLARLVDCIYGKGIDGYTYSAQLLKDDIIATYEQPLTI